MSILRKTLWALALAGLVWQGSLAAHAQDRRVGRFSKSTLVDLTHDNDGYTANDVVGGLLTFGIYGRNTADCKPCSGVLLGAKLYDDSTLESTTFVLVVLQSQPTAVADDAAFTLSDADTLNVVACYTLSGQTYQSISAASNAFVQFTPCQSSQPSEVPFSTTDGNLYAFMYTTGTPNPTSTADLHLRLEYLPDQP